MSRLTKKIENPQYSNDYEMLCAHSYHLINKIGELEDLLEKYEIKDLSELEIALDQYYHRYDKVETRRVNDNDKY